MKTTHAPRSLVGLLAAAVLAAACSVDSTDSNVVTTTTPEVTTAPVETTRPSVDPEPEPPGEDGEAPSADDGWIGGEPDWSGSDASDEASGEHEAAAAAAMAEAELAEATLADGDAKSALEATATTAAPTTTMATADTGTIELSEAATTPSGADGDVAPEPEQPQTKITGGSIDDNERFEDYLAYRADFAGLGIPVRDLDPTGRIVVRVTGERGLPAAGAKVVVAGGQTEVTLRTTADGTVRFHPNAYPAGAGPFTISVGNARKVATRGQDVILQTSLPTAAGETVALDVLFLLDATGSMHDEIHQLKVTIHEVARRIHRLPGDLNVRLGMTLYRDEFDSFLTSTFDLTPDIDTFAAALSGVVADGGDDYPEALDEALAEALSQPSWRSPADTVQLIFLVADAPPQVLRQVPVPYTDSMREAARRGIKIFPVSSSGTDDQAEFVFRQLAQFTGARYVFLTYGTEGRATGASTDIDQRDYEELSLDDLIVRLVAEELAALHGLTPAEPAPEQPTSPEDDQQGN